MTYDGGDVDSLELWPPVAECSSDTGATGAAAHHPWWHGRMASSAPCHITLLVIITPSHFRHTQGSAIIAIIYLTL